MDDFCDCSQCPHHCGEDDAVTPPADKKTQTTAPLASDDSSDNPLNTKASADKKVKKLKKAISDLGFKLEDTEEGIKVTM